MNSFEWMFFPLLVVAIAAIVFFSARRSRRESLALRLEGIRVNRLVEQLLIDLQQHRGMVNAFLSGDNSFGPKIEQKQAAIGQDIAALDALHGQGLMTKHRWEGIRSVWQTLRAEAMALPAEESFRRHSELIRAVLYSMGDIAERSQIIGICAADFILVDALWSKLPAVAEGLGQARGMGSSVAAKGYCSSVARIKLRFLEEHIGETVVSVDSDLAHADTAEAAALKRAWGATHVAVREFLALLDEKLINVERPTIDAGHYFSAGTKAMDAVFHAFDQACDALESTLAGRGADARTA